MSTNGTLCHDLLTEKTIPKLSFNPKADYGVWKDKVKEKFIELFGIDVIKENACEPEFIIEERVDKEGYEQIRFSFFSEVGARVPCYLLVPSSLKKGEKLPVMITLQGHNKMGFASSIGRTLCHETLSYDLGNGQFAIQAVKNGYIALAIEQRGMGERKAFNTFERRVMLGDGTCYYEAMTALSLGRTLLGERIHDVSRAIDMLSNFECCDLDKIGITGNSGGGTASFYCACYDERIKLSAPSCAFCDYKGSILQFYHCSCNYVPCAYRYFDMQDLTCLIAPRNLLVVAGEHDTAFLIDGVKRAFATAQKVFEKAGVKDNCKLVVHGNGHYWDDKVMWTEIKNLTNKLGW
ncbi:MAG: acetylxylan esterase [Clostridia bacterium]|nr:acetylxylan esterase [Clostridia bacterium]